jgi:hypothetical protein
MLAYIAIGLLELLFIAGIAGALYGSTQVMGHQKTGYFVGAGVTALGFLLFNCMMWCYWQKLQVAIAVIDATADFMAATKRMVSVTIYYFIIAVITLVVGGFGLVGTVAMNKVDAIADANCSAVNSTECTYHKEIKFNNQTIAMLVFSSFGLFWILSFIREKTKFIYMISATQYYYTSNKD